MAVQWAESAAGNIPPTVLLVEDDLDTVDMYEIYLNRVGYRVATAHTDEDARRVFDEVHPDIVVTDLGLPGRSAGLSFIQHVNTGPPTPAVPIIVVTGQDPGVVPHAATASVATVLVKPVLPDALEAEMRRILERSQELRHQATALRARAPQILERATLALRRSRAISARSQEAARARVCPGCGARLCWRDTRDMEGVTFDYYEPCGSCSRRFFFNRTTGTSYRLP
jgi:DNA-binding response OmpR family regulator